MTDAFDVRLGALLVVLEVMEASGDRTFAGSELELLLILDEWEFEMAAAGIDPTRALATSWAVRLHHLGRILTGPDTPVRNDEGA